MEAVKARKNAFRGSYDADQETAEWSQCGPRGSNDELHDLILNIVGELSLSGVLKTTGEGSSYHLQTLSFQNGVEKEASFIRECGYDECFDISYRPTGSAYTETSGDFETNVDDFEQEFWERVDSNGELQQFRANQNALMNMITRGWFRAEGIMCEDEDRTMEIKITKTSSTVKIFDHTVSDIEDDGVEPPEVQSPDQEEELSIAQRVKKRHKVTKR